MYKLTYLTALGAILFPHVAFAATPQRFDQLVYMIISFINPLAAMLATVAVLIFFWGIVKYIFSAGGEEHQKGRELIVWGIVALFVLFSVWSLARIVSSVFLGGGAVGSGATQGVSEGVSGTQQTNFSRSPR